MDSEERQRKLESMLSGFDIQKAGDIARTLTKLSPENRGKLISLIDAGDENPSESDTALSSGGLERVGPWLKREAWLVEKCDIPFLDLRLAGEAKTPYDGFSSAELYTSDKVRELDRGYWIQAAEDILCRRIEKLDDISTDQKKVFLNSDRISLRFWVPPFWKYIVVVFASLYDDDRSQGWDAVLYIRDEPSSNQYAVNSFDFKSPEIHTLNSREDFVLAGNEYLYLQFFMHVVRGDEGCFRMIECYSAKPRLRRAVLDEVLENPVQSKILESIDSILNGEKNSLLEERVGNASALFKMSPPKVARVTEEGLFIYRVYLEYDNNIFRSWLQLKYDGMVEMKDDEMVLKVDPYFNI